MLLCKRGRARSRPLTIQDHWLSFVLQIIVKIVEGILPRHLILNELLDAWVRNHFPFLAEWTEIEFTNRSFPWLYLEFASVLNEVVLHHTYV